ncbi:MAG: hypothetical protein Q4C70_10240 [Planctomycetia bacterium]|nr:hypothetical protein [Planctomycetia bacterium]
MSFLTRKPENASDTGVSPATESNEKSGIGMNSANNTSMGAGNAGGKKVSLAELYQALTDSQRQITEYLLAREAESRCGDGVSASTGNVGGMNAVSGNSASAGEAGRVDMRTFLESMNSIQERINMLGMLMDQQMMPAIGSRFDALENLLKNLPTTGSASVTSGVSVADSMSESGNVEVEKSLVNEAIQESTASGYEADSASQMNSGMAQSAQMSAPPRASRSGGNQDELGKVFFGEMALEPSIQNELQYILQGILAHDSVSCYLGGILMMFQSSAPDKMVLLLKDLGEAYYRWANQFPDSNLEVLEDALVRWAQWLCESAGLPNRIETVMPGQRFDAGRHNSTTRGVTVTQVHGWVVLRGNGSVYSKALVDVQ